MRNCDNLIKWPLLARRSNEQPWLAQAPTPSHGKRNLCGKRGPLIRWHHQLGLFSKAGTFDEGPMSSILSRAARKQPNSPQPLRLKTHGQFDRRVFGMIGTCLGPNNQRGFLPGLAPKPLRQVFREHHRKHGNQGFIALSENDRTLANDDHSRLTRPLLHTLQLMRRMREHTGKQSSRGQMFRGRFAIIHHTPPHLKPAGPFLGMFTHGAIRLWPIRRTPRDEVEFLLLPNHPQLPKVPLPNLIPIHQTIRQCRAAGQGHALRLGFHRHKPSARTTPRTDHAHRPNATPQIQARFHRRCPRSPIPRRQRIIRGKAMTILQLQDPKMATKSRARFPLASHKHRRRHRARLRPSFEHCSHLILHFQTWTTPATTATILFRTTQR